MSSLPIRKCKNYAAGTCLDPTPETPTMRYGNRACNKCYSNQVKLRIQEKRTPKENSLFKCEKCGILKDMKTAFHVNLSTQRIYTRCIQCRSQYSHTSSGSDEEKNKPSTEPLLTDKEIKDLIEITLSQILEDTSLEQRENFKRTFLMHLDTFFKEYPK